MSFVDLKVKNTIATLTIQREEALNALNPDVLNQLMQKLNEVENNKEIRVLVITGAGTKAFVAGADIKSMRDMKPEEAMKFAQLGQSVFRRLEVMQVPVIAAVNGFALGGGFELAMSCDFIYASDNAVFGLPEVGLGLMPGFGGTQRLSRYVGMAKAKELTFSAAKVKTEAALKMGIVNQVVPLADLIPEVMKVAERIAEQAPIAVSASKGAIQQGYDVGLDPGLHLERTLFSELFRSEDKNIGIDAFINKQKPTFVGK